MVQFDFTAAHVNISIHALRVEGDAEDVADYYGEEISIHALRVEGDPGGVRPRLF